MTDLFLLRDLRVAISGALIAGLAACGGGGSDMSSAMSTSSTTPSSAQMAVMMSDASSDDWSLIGVKIQSIALVAQSGGTPVTVYSPAQPVMVNLVQLDNIRDILGNATVPSGTYTSAILTLSANAGDVVLRASSDPSAEFAAAAGAQIPASQIQIQGTQGAAGSLTVPVNVVFDTPLVVSAGQSNAIDLEFDLAHPAFIIAHQPSGLGDTLWAVDFRWPIRRHPIYDITHLVLRHMYGNVTAVAADDSSITITKELPLLPIANPETPVATNVSLQILADATNGTLFYDVDAGTSTTIMNFSSVASSLEAKYVRVAARYQENGTLIAVRIWASSEFDDVWLSPEGHVLNVDAANDVLTVLNESGQGVAVSIDANTKFFFRQPDNASADALPIATGPGFLANNNIVRGFKVHASVVDPLATPLIAQSIDIEAAAYSGQISATSPGGFTYTHDYRTAADDYVVALGYISAASANGTNADGNPISGFKFWDFAYPTLVTSGSGAIADFSTIASGAVDFGGIAGAVSAWGASDARWADSVNPTGWSIPSTVLLPTPVPLGTVSTAYANNTFAMTVFGGANPVTVDVSTTSGSATLVYEVDRIGNVLTITPVDITTNGGMAELAAGLAAGAKVKVYGIPQTNQSLKAYVLAYFAGTLPLY
jgi:hypothetical protein